jgi:hypothetical protein
MNRKREKKKTYSQASRLENSEELQLHHNHEKILFLTVLLLFAQFKMHSWWLETWLDLTNHRIIESSNRTIKSSNNRICPEKTRMSCSAVNSEGNEESAQSAAVWRKVRLKKHKHAATLSLLLPVLVLFSYTLFCCQHWLSLDKFHSCSNRKLVTWLSSTITKISIVSTA